MGNRKVTSVYAKQINLKVPGKELYFRNISMIQDYFFDDNGKVYVVHGQHKLFVTELNADVKSVKGKSVEIWNKGVDDAHHSRKNAGMEGSHVYKINGMYYILVRQAEQKDGRSVFDPKHLWTLRAQSDNTRRQLLSY